MDKNYWNDIYWEKHFKEDDLERIEDFWIEKYLEYFPTPSKCVKNFRLR